LLLKRIRALVTEGGWKIYINNIIFIYPRTAKPSHH